MMADMKLENATLMKRQEYLKSMSGKDVCGILEYKDIKTSLFKNVKQKHKKVLKL